MKYRARPIIIAGERFDSQKEYRRWQELTLLQRAGEIRALRRQVRFSLIPNQYAGGKLVERACSYVADFVYEERTPEGWAQVVEDVKGYRTPEYIIKRKLMLYLCHIRLREV